MTKQQIIDSINALAVEYHGMNVHLGGLSSKSKTELLTILDRWSVKVHHRGIYMRIMGELNLTENQRIAYSMGYADSMTPEQAREYERAMEHYKLAMDQ